VSPSIAGAAAALAGAAGLLLAAVALTGPRRSDRPADGRLSRLVARAGVGRLTPAAVVALALAAALVGGVVALAVSAVPVVGLLVAAAGATAPFVVLRRRADRRARELRRAWPDAIDVLTSGVRAGLALPDAVAALATGGPPPMRPAFARFAVEYRATGSFTDALDTVGRTLADPVADRVVAALRLARDLGGSELGPVLRTLALMLREEARTRAEVEARQSWSVSAARLAVAAPWLTLVLLSTRPEAARAYATPAGTVVLCCAAGLSAAAYIAMRRIGRLPTDERQSP
jgi:tight adherence protein B